LVTASTSMLFKRNMLCNLDQCNKDTRSGEPIPKTPLSVERVKITGRWQLIVMMLCS